MSDDPWLTSLEGLHMSRRPTRLRKTADRTSGPTFPAATHRAIVVGAGISGLTAAFRLRQQGFDVKVLESTDIVGGKMSCYRQDGYTINRASSLLTESYATLKSLIDDVGLSDTIGKGELVLGIPRDGKLNRIRATSPLTMLIDGLRTPLLSFRSKLLLRRVLVDAVKMRKTLSFANLGEAAPFDVETVAEYCQRRLNPELQDYLVEPTVRAIYTANADELSVVDFFFSVMSFVAGGALSYSGGVDFLVRALAKNLDVRTGSTVTHVEQDPDSATVSWTTADGTDHSERVDACVLAVSGQSVADLFPQLDPIQREILVDRIHYTVNYAGHFALRHKPDETATQIEVPQSDDDSLCVITLSHNTEPDSAPPGAGLVSGYWLTEWGIARRGMTDDQIVADMLPAMEKFLPGITENLAFAHIDRWDPGVVQSYSGWYGQVARLAERANDTDRVQLAGDFMSAASTNACALSGELAAGRIARAVSAPKTLTPGPRTPAVPRIGVPTTSGRA